MSSTHIVVDASAVVDLLARVSDRAGAVRSRLSGTVMHAPAHFDAEVLSTLGRLQRAGVLTVPDVDAAVHELRAAPVLRHELPPLIAGAWARRNTFRLTDALYVELAAASDWVLVTTDHRLGRAWSAADVIG